jgi:hypothetical protein
VLALHSSFLSDNSTIIPAIHVGFSPFISLSLSLSDSIATVLSCYDEFLLKRYCSMSCASDAAITSMRQLSKASAGDGFTVLLFHTFTHRRFQHQFLITI